MRLNKVQPEVNKLEARQLKSLQTEVQGNCSNALGELTTLRSRKSKHGT